MDNPKLDNSKLPTKPKVPAIMFQKGKGYRANSGIVNGWCTGMPTPDMLPPFIAVSGAGNVWTILTLNDQKERYNFIFGMRDLFEELTDDEVFNLKCKLL